MPAVATVGRRGKELAPDVAVGVRRRGQECIRPAPPGGASWLRQARSSRPPPLLATAARSRRPTLPWGRADAIKSAFAVSPTESPTKNLMCGEFYV
jgi:hypothetical protein